MERCFVYDGDRECTNGRALRDPDKRTQALGRSFISNTRFSA
jgi:hypothetical protein